MVREVGSVVMSVMVRSREVGSVVVSVMVCGARSWQCSGECDGLWCERLTALNSI